MRFHPYFVLCGMRLHSGNIVDDIVITGSDDATIKQLVMDFGKFLICELSALDYFLGILVCEYKEGLFLVQ